MEPDEEDEENKDYGNLEPLDESVFLQADTNKNTSTSTSTSTQSLKSKEPIIIDSESSNGFQDDIEMDPEDIKRAKEEKKLFRKIKKKEKEKLEEIEEMNKAKSSKSSFMPQLTFQNDQGEIVREDTTKSKRRGKQALDDGEGNTRRWSRLSKRKGPVKFGEENDSERSEEEDVDDSLADFVIEDDEEVKSDDGSGEESTSKKKRKRRAREYSPEPEIADFTAVKSYSTKSAFQIYLQYLISCVLQEDFMASVFTSTKDKNYFSPAITKIQDLVLNRKEYILRSSVWEESFKKNLESFPIFRSWTSTYSIVDCEACQRHNHPAGYEVSLEGPRYDAEALWKGKILPPDQYESSVDGDGKLYRLGRFCHLRTELFHKLHHYKYSLFRKIERKTETYDSKESAEVILAELLDNAGWVDECYRELKDLLTEADDFGLESLSTT